MHTVKTVVLCVGIAGLSLAALAQPPSPAVSPAAPTDAGRPAVRSAGPGKLQAAAPVVSKAAWDVEAMSVAKRLGATDEQTKAIVKAYVEARESQMAATEKYTKELAQKPRDKSTDGTPPGARGGDTMKAMEEINTAEREKLQKALAAATTPDLATKAVESLGTFNRQWDSLANSIAGMKLDEAKQQEALVAIEAYIVANAKARAGGINADREAMRKTMQESRKTMLDSLKKTLSDEQYKEFEKALPGRVPNRGGGPGGGGGGAGGGGGG